MKKEMLYLKDSAAKMGIELSDLQLEQFDTYYAVSYTHLDVYKRQSLLLFR